MKLGYKALLLSAVPLGTLVTPLATPALAQDSEMVEDDRTIIVTGTRRAERSSADTVAPVDVVSGAELANQADSDLSNLLRVSVPSFNVNTQPISDAATFIRPANLRGLSPDNTLVLVNGKRQHRGAVIAFLGGGISDGAQSPDISVIPAVAIKQVEVLRDGASSQYGSDAIAGVMNFILKDSPDGGTVSARLGSTYAGDGDNYTIAANFGVPIGDAGFANFSAEFGEADDTSRSVQRDDAAALIAAGNTAVNDPAQVWGQPILSDDFKGFVNMGYEVSDALELYAFGNYASRNVDGGFFFRNPTNRGGVYEGPLVDPLTGAADPDGVPSVRVGDLSVDSAGDCPAGIPLTAGGGLLPDPTILAQVTGDGFDGNCFSFIELFPGGFTPRFVGDITDFSIAGGVRGEVLGGLSYDVSYRHGQSESDFFIRNTINASLGPNTPTEFNPGGYIQTENVVNLDLGYEFLIGEGSVFVAAGAEYRDEEFTIKAGDRASYELGPLAAPSTAFPTGQGFSSSSNGFGGFSPNNAGSNKEDSKAVYVDVEADPIEALTVQGAVRFEDTKSFGSTTTWKLGGLFRVTDNLRVRGTYSTGFHAPSAGQANVTNVTTAFVGGVLRDEGTFPLLSPAGVIAADFVESENGFRPTLGPEKSDSITFGVAADVGPVSITLDYFNIKLKDRISRSSQIDFTAALDLFAQNAGVPVTPGSNTATLIAELAAAGAINREDFAGFEDLASFAVFNNAFDTRTQGLDFVANADLEVTDSGSTSVTLAINYTKTDVTNADATISDTRIRQLEENIPNWKGFLNLTHQEGALRGLFRANYFGSFYEAHLDSGDLPINAGARLTFDAEVGYEVIEGLEFAIGAQNLLDTYPTRNPFAGVAGAEYTLTSPFGFNGGSYYLRARFSW
jgi:iron complex outermembrane receptor protein